MKSTRKTAIFAAFFALAALAGGADPVFAGQKMQAIMNNTDIGRELSAGELLQQFRTERERLIRQRAKDKQPHLVKNKIKILDGKISFLESQMHTRPASKPAKVLVPQKPVVSAPKTARSVINVPMRPYARPEARRRIFVARVPVTVSPQSWAKVSARLAPQTQAVPAKTAAPVSPKPAAVPPAVVKPAVVKPAPVPVKVDMVSANGPSGHQQAMEHPVPVKIAPAPAVVSAPAPSGPRAPKTGREWREMNAAEKDIYALSVMGNLGRHDVFLEKSYGFYVREIDRRLAADASLDGEYVYRILITSAYENEPEVRQDIDKIGK